MSLKENKKNRIKSKEMQRNQLTKSSLVQQPVFHADLVLRQLLLNCDGRRSKVTQNCNSSVLVCCTM